MKILVTGDYTNDYNRTNIILKGLENRPDVSLFEYPIPSKKRCNTKEFKAIAQTADIVFLPSFTHNSVPFVRKLTQKPIVFDPLISRYLTKVFDYKLVWKFSPRALKNYYKDKLAFMASDLILADTIAHKNYFVKTFKLMPEKISVLPIGVNTTDFATGFSIPVPSNEFKIGFYGGFIPLQGVKNIIEAARILKENTAIKFELIGTGFEFEEIKEQVKTWGLNNINFHGWIPYNELPAYISRWDICLGIFGTTIKSDFVIPNKIFHYAAMGKPIITKRSDAISEIFTEDVSIALSSTEPDQIAEKILTLYAKPDYRNSIAHEAYKLMTDQYNQNKIAEKFLDILKHKFNFL